MLPAYAPRHLAVDTRGRVWVLDVARPHPGRRVPGIHVFGADGAHHRSFGGAGLWLTSFAERIAVDRRERVWVASVHSVSWRLCIGSYDVHGRYLGDMRKFDDRLVAHLDDMQCSLRNGIEHLFLADSKREQVLVLDLDGQLVHVVGGLPGFAGPRPLRPVILSPYALAFDSEHHLLVLDKRNGKLTVLDDKDQVLTAPSVPSARLVSLDSSDMVYISLAGKSIQVFTF